MQSVWNGEDLKVKIVNLVDDTKGRPGIIKNYFWALRDINIDGKTGAWLIYIVYITHRTNKMVVTVLLF